MKLYKCQKCGLLLSFENRNCSGCGSTLGYLPVENELTSIQQTSENTWTALAASGVYKLCHNSQYDACNWMLPADAAETLCLACRHNQTIPDMNVTENVTLWRKMEIAKHRLFYSILRLGLPHLTRDEDAENGLGFDFLAELPGEDKIMTGHDEGMITIALKEADDAEREARRTSMHEPYRTLLGHFRHEIGHYYWDRLVRDQNKQDACRALFGDDRIDYDEALEKYYKEGVPVNWQENYVSFYATSHPWEDFAETWAHYFHIMDCLETSQAFGLEVHPAIAADDTLHAKAALDPYTAQSFHELVDLWLPLTYALNAMNRSMGLADLYPFVLSKPVIEKLEFIHQLVSGCRINNACGASITN